jgi:hypothetical protein
LWIHGGELDEGLVPSHQILTDFRHGHLFDGIELAPQQGAAVFMSPFAPSVFDQDAAHGLGGGSEEVAAAVPIGPRRIAIKTEVRFVNECRWLERLSRRLVR